MFLEFDWVCVWGGGGLFYVKMPNLPVPTYSGPNILGPPQKFKILLPTLFSPGTKVSKKICHTHERQKLRDEMDFLETDCFGPGPIWHPWPNIAHMHGVEPVLKISSRSFWSVKSFNFFQGQTHALPIHKGMGKICFMALWYLLLHCVCFAHAIPEG